MKKTTFTLLAAVFTASVALAQTVDDGIKFIYYQRYKSAKETLEKVVASKPTDALAAYWLGQAYLGDKDVAGAKAVYQKALNGGLNDPWIWVGMGHVESMEGNIASAKQRFEQAITSTKGKKGAENPDILNAIGRANADGGSEKGDPMYGVEKLKRAQELNKTNPDISIQLGVCYLKLGTEHGGDAVEAFRDAYTRNPQYAEAYYRTGKVYQSQNNKEFMDEWFAKAINADPAYAPVYLAYFLYYQEKDVNVAKEYLDKYVVNADKDCGNDYYLAEYMFRAGKYQESLNKVKEMEGGNCKDYVRINVLYAYNYDRLGDSLTAKTYIEKFFATAPQEKKDPRDYVLAGQLLAKFPGSEDAAGRYLDTAVAMDTVMANKLKYLNIQASIYGRAQMFDKQLDVFMKMAAMKGKLTATDYYYLSQAAISAKNCTVADSISKKYVELYPEQPQGYSFNVQAAKLCDVDSSQGLAVEPITKYNAFLMKDSVKNATTIYRNLYYLLLFYNDKAKDYVKALDVARKMLSIMPTDQFVPPLIPQLEKLAAQQSGGTAPGGGGGKGNSPGGKSQ